MHVGSIQFRILGLVAVGTICSLIACSGGSGASGNAKSVAPASLPPPIIVAPAAVAIGSTDLTASVTSPLPNVSYNWTITGGTLQGAATGTSVSFSASQAGALTLTCTAILGSESSKATAQVHVQATPPATPQILAPSNVSVGSTGLTASLAQPEGDTAYTWTIIDGTIVAGTTSTAVTFNAGAMGTLTLSCTATNAVGTRTAQALVQVVQSAPATPIISAPSQVTAQSVHNLASIPAQANCLYTWTLAGGTITSGQGTTSLAFTAGAAGTMLLRCTVTNSASVSVSAQQSITVLPASLVAGYYGSCLNGDDIGNIVIGWNTANDDCNRVTSYRFRATHTGNLQSIRPFFIWSSVKPGYALGNGGNIQIQIQADDGTSNHFPSGSSLSSLVYDYPVPVPMDSGSNYYPLLTFSSPARLTAGQLYHIIFTNVATDPKANWVSLDCIWMASAYSQEQPTLPNTDMAILERNTSGGWVKFSRGGGAGYTPCYQLNYDDGASQGQGYLGAFGYPDASFVNPKPISGVQGVRESFTVSGSDRVVSSVSVRVRYSSGPSPLTVRVEKADGTLVGQGTVGNIPVSPGNNGSSWAKVTFASPLTLSAGQSYNLVLSAPSDSVYRTHTLYKGMNSGYKSTTFFGDGHAEFNDGTGWKRWDAWGVQNRLDNDLQFFFETR